MTPIMKNVIEDITFCSVMAEIRKFGDKDFKFRKNAEEYEKAQSNVERFAAKGSDRKKRAFVRLKLLRLYTNYVNNYNFRIN